ncbi:MAG: META domain-containing protein [Chloroflexota bacterium]
MPTRRLGVTIAPVAALTAVIVLSACSSAGSQAGSAGRSAGASVVAASATAGSGLEGTLWRLTGYLGPDGNAVEVPEAISASATFADATVSGNAGCNDYTGGYTVDGDKLTIGPLASTRKACGPAQSALETVFLTALGRVATFTASPTELQLKTAEGKVGLSFAATQPAGLSKTRWVATGVNNGKGAVSSVVTGTSLTAIFAEAGTVAGSGGCNDYSGPYTSTATTIKIGPLAATRMVCNTPAGVDEQETLFLTAMQAATTWTISGEKLELRDDGGALQASFRATVGGS